MNRHEVKPRCGCTTVVGGTVMVCIVPAGHATGAHYFVKGR